MPTETQPYADPKTLPGYVSLTWYDPQNECYSKRYPARGTGKQGRNAREGNPRAMRIEFLGWTRAMHECAAQYHADQARHWQTIHAATLDCAARVTFGRAFDPIGDYRISAIGRDEFAQAFKIAARTAAHTESAHLDCAHAHRIAARQCVRWTECKRAQVAQEAS